MPSRRLLLAAGIAAGAGAAIGAGLVGRAYAAAMAEAEARLAAGRSRLVRTRFGQLEFAEAGTGRPLLMIHGTGGGFDQGLAFARRFSDKGFRVIAPSRFGYLRSDFPAEASSENQADAFVDLLDALGIDRLPVAGGSAGALSAIAFAIRHPQRCSALLPLVPATHAPKRPSLRRMSPLQERVLFSLLGNDFAFWAAIEAMPDRLIGTMLATDPALVHAASSDEQQRVRSIMRDILPVSRRSRGLLNDARLSSDPAPMALATIRVPTLALSLEDDRFGTADGARHIAAQVPGAKLVLYPTGGHVFVGHDADVFQEAARFLDDLRLQRSGGAGRR